MCVLNKVVLCGPVLTMAVCNAGYEGKNCQVDIDECEPEPCENGGECFQRSELLYYGVLSGLEDREFNYEDAAGFLCHCQPWFAGKPKDSYSYLMTS